VFAYETPAPGHEQVAAMNEMRRSAPETRDAPVKEAAPRTLGAPQAGSSLVVRFAGDSGDGMQLTGSRFTQEAALGGADLATFPDFPAEIRAPVGTTFGVSAFQIQFGGRRVRTPGDHLDVLVALNPAALKVNVVDLRPSGTLIVDIASFGERNLKKAGYDTNPLDGHDLDNFRVMEIDITKLTQAAVKPLGVGNRDANRARNFWTLGLVLWLTGRNRAATQTWIRERFEGDSQVRDANLAALDAGHAYGETAELPRLPEVLAAGQPAPLPPGRYRTITGVEALAYGLVEGGRLAGLELFYGSYPITPASGLLHALARLDAFGVRTFQAEDEIAAVCAAIGASYAGKLGVTGSSGPGIALKTEALGLAIATELPLVVIDAQRGGPSTGLPTKTEQSDLFQAVLGRNADSPLVVLAAATPGDCFDVAIEAVRLAGRYMTPVILLTDGFLANASEPWLVPDLAALESFPVSQGADPTTFAPFARDPASLARAWVPAGTPGLRHRIGGIERADKTGDISYDPANHQLMTDFRRHKIEGVARDIPEQTLTAGEQDDEVLILGWGSTFGAIESAVDRLRDAGHKVAHAHVRHVWPLPRNLGALIDGYRHVLVPELNAGQFSFVLQGVYGRKVESLTKVTGKPFTAAEIEMRVLKLLEA
jgi:2-oxoglutarate ferredoxin oxidoreductase subunit alpha